MFVGHIGAALVVKRVEPRLNLGALLLATLFSDLLLWVLVIAGVEQVVVPPDFFSKHFLTFIFPYSHGLSASLIWSLLAGVSAYAVLEASHRKRRWFAVAIAVSVLSHFPLDALVHVPELPLLGEHSPKVGLGLWENMPLALVIEVGFAAVALYLFLQAATVSASKRVITITLSVFTALLTIAGPYLDTAPPRPLVLAGWSLAALLFVVLAGFWIEGRFSLEINK